VVGIVVVSHSPALAEAAVDLAREMLPGRQVPMAVAAGTASGGLGTDATRVAEAIRSVASRDGVLVVMDLGSAVLSAGLALELLGTVEGEVVLSPGPLVEGLVAAAVTAGTGADLDRVADEAAMGLLPKVRQLEG
jgi:phosphoenolpyruvate---glycerone phosphotransferase subunit DhaM